MVGARVGRCVCGGGQRLANAADLSSTKSKRRSIWVAVKTPFVAGETWQRISLCPDSRKTRRNSRSLDKVGDDPVGVAALTGTAGTAPFELGVNYLLIAADHDKNPVETQVSVTVTVLDTEAPTLAPDPSTTMLWPPNRQMRAVTIEANAADNSGGPVTLDVEVTSNESDPEDWIIDSVDSESGVIELQLRAERSTSGDGRVYTVTITATDEASNSSTAAVEICVPHDNRRHE